MQTQRPISLTCYGWHELINRVSMLIVVCMEVVVSILTLIMVLSLEFDGEYLAFTIMT